MKDWNPEQTALVRQQVLEVVEREQGAKLGVATNLVVACVRADLGLGKDSALLVEAALGDLELSGYLTMTRDAMGAGTKYWRLSAMGEAALRQ